MSVEELQLIITSLEGVANGTLSVVMLYFGVGVLKLGMGLSLVAGIAYGAYKLLNKAINGESLRAICDSERAYKELIDFIHHDIKDNSSYIYASDIVNIRDKIRRAS